MMSVMYRVFDYDQFSYDDTIGVVTLDLSCLLLPEGPREISGWLPIFDTFSGMLKAIVI